MGSFMVVWFEAPDVEKAFTELATSSDEFSIWFRGQVRDATRVDLGAPMKVRFPTCLSTGQPENDLPMDGAAPAAGVL